MPNESELVFIGYRCGKSKKGEEYYMLNFITSPIVSDKGEYAYSTPVSIFTDRSKYNSFIKENELLSSSMLPYEVRGDKVRYYL